MTTRLSLSLLLLLLVAGCSGVRPVVPVSGNTEILAGEWAGSYSSSATGRSGSITFRLKAGTDSAWGDVVMVAPGEASKEPMSAAQAPNVVPISIAFVSCTDGGVTGRLAPYHDPVSGEIVETTFEGLVVNQREFTGKFFSHFPTSRRFVTGTWSVRRANHLKPSATPSKVKGR